MPNSIGCVPFSFPRPGLSSVNTSIRELPHQTHHSRPKRLAKSYLLRNFHSLLSSGFHWRTLTPLIPRVIERSAKRHCGRNHNFDGPCSTIGTDQENSTSFDQMAGAIWRSVTLGFFLLFLLKQLSKFVSFLFFLRFLPRFWDRSGKRSQSLQIMGAIWRDWYGCVLPRVSLEIIFQKSLL